MQGFPKWLNTREDYIYVKENFPPEQWKPVFQSLLDERMQWLNTGLLKNEADGVNDETHKVVGGDSDMPDTPAQYYQYEFKEDPNCRMFKLGFTVDEVEQLLSS